MALRTPDFNPAQTKADTARNLNDAELKANINNPSDNPDVAEKDPDNSWDSSGVTGDKSDEKNSIFNKANIKKKSATIAIILILAGGGLGIGGVFLPALLPMSILANLAKKFNIETSWDARSNAMLVSKLAGGATQGCDGLTTIFCKFSRPSSRFLTQLEKNGIQAFDGDVPIVAKSLLNPFPNTRPTKFVFTDSAGNKIESTAKTLSNDIAENPELRAAMHSASMSRLMSLGDAVAKKVMGFFGANLTDKLKGAKNEEDITKKVDDELGTAENKAITAAKAEAEVGGKVAEKEVEALLIKDSTATAEKLKKTGKGGLVGLAISGVCVVADAPKLITKAVRAFRMAQLIKYSMVFLSAFGAIKAGDATPEETSAIGNELTKVVGGKSAMDSFGMNYAITGATKPSTDNYKSFIPTSMVTSKLGKYNDAVNSAAKNDACKAAGTLEFAATVDIMLGSTVIGAVGNLVFGYALGEVIGVVAPAVIKAVISVIPTKEILGWFLGDFTAGISGEQVGDAITSGASHVMGQTANAGGNMPLTPNDAVAYVEQNKKVQLAYAEEDRATLSPFDISSPNTMLGSIVHSLLPYYTSASSSVGSIAHGLSFIGNVIFGSFGAALKPLAVGAESTDLSQFTNYCSDPSLPCEGDNAVATGPYGNIIYGVPIGYLNKSPTDVLNTLSTEHQIDDQGNPIKDSDLASWIALCTDGTADAAKDCRIKDKDDKTADYALYTIDHRIQQSLDGPDTTTTTTATGATAQ